MDDSSFAQIVALAADAIICLDSAQRITLFNSGAERTFGYAAAEMLGKDHEVLVPERFRLEHRKHIERFATGPAVSRHMGERGAIYALRANGEEFPAEASISKITAVDGDVLTIILRDISYQKSIESTLESRVAARTAELEAEIARREQAQAQLVRSQRMEAFGQLTGGVAHDFNNLLTIIGGNLELMVDRISDDRQKKLLGRALSAVEMGARLTRRLLTFARRGRFESRLIQLDEQVLAISELLRRTLGESIDIIARIPEGLWPIHADPSEIENALLNLAINARDAMPSGGTLTIGAENVRLQGSLPAIADGEGLSAGSYVRLFVRDTGVGMSDEVMARAFEPFFTTKEPGRGTGLGLASIYGFARQSGGSVAIESALGRGTTVSLYLPRADVEIADAEPGEGNGSVSGPARERILIVEDNDDVRAVAVEHLSNAGYEVIACVSGAAAISLLEEGGGVDLVFSDVVMPGGISGIDLANWLKTHRPGLPVLLTTGFTEGLMDEDSAFTVLPKPYSALDLQRALRKLLDRE